MQSLRIMMRLGNPLRIETQRERPNMHSPETVASDLTAVITTAYSHQCIDTLDVFGGHD